MDVFVADSHTRMALAAVRELGAAGHRVTALEYFGRPGAASRSRYCSGFLVLPERPEEWNGFLAERGIVNPVVVPMSARSQAALADGTLAARHLVPSAEILERANDKRQSASLAASLGIPVPEAVNREKPKRYPVLLKYWFGEALGLPAHKRFYAARDFEDYTRAKERMEALQAPVLAQEYIPGYDFGVSACLNKNSEPVALYCHRGTRTCPAEGGPACLAETIWVQSMVDGALAMFRSLGLTGFAMCEFRGTPENYKFMEINPRAWGSFSVGRAAGIPLGECYARLAAGEDLPVVRDCLYPVGLRVQFLVNDLAAGLMRLKRGHPGTLLMAAGSALSPSVKGGVYERGDLKASMACVRESLRRGKINSMN